MSEIKRTDESKIKQVETRSAKPLQREQRVGDVQIVGGSDVPRTGKPTVIDKNTPTEQPQQEVHIHADRKSYKAALENDQ